MMKASTFSYVYCLFCSTYTSCLSLFKLNCGPWVQWGLCALSMSSPILCGASVLPGSWDSGREEDSALSKAAWKSCVLPWDCAPQASSLILLSSCTFFLALLLSQKQTAIFKQTTWCFSPLPTALILCQLSQQDSSRVSALALSCLLTSPSHLVSFHQTSAPTIPPHFFFFHLFLLVGC